MPSRLKLDVVEKRQETGLSENLIEQLRACVPAFDHYGGAEEAGLRAALANFPD